MVIVMIMILALTSLAASLIFAAQTQTWTAYNYRLETQARYAAEAGVQYTMNWLANSYTMPSSYTPYDTTKYPVQDTTSHQSVVLSAVSGVSSNYPDATVQSAYNTALANQSVTGLSNTTFSTSAILLRMTGGALADASWASGTSGPPQTWQITSVGTISGVRSASVQIVTTYERTSTPIFTYGVAGDGTNCPDVNFSGGTMNSWDSSKGTYAATVQASGGNVASNGNVTLSGGSTAIDGTIYSGVNASIGSGCTNGVTNGSGSTPTVALLSPLLSYPNPPVPSPMTPTTNINQNSSSSCDSGWPAGACTHVSSGVFSIAPNTPATGYGNLTANQNVHLSAGTYYFNSFQMNGGSVTLDSVPVVINLGGSGISSGGNLFVTNSSTTINDLGVPANLQVVTACCTTGGVQWANPPVMTMNSSSSMYGVFYAPNAYVHITGSSQFLGAVISQKTTSDSSGGFSYDRALSNELVSLGSYRSTGFSWSKF